MTFTIVRLLTPFSIILPLYVVWGLCYDFHNLGDVWQVWQVGK